MPKDQVSSTIKALDILECFAGNQKEWSLKELVDALSMPQTTIFRQLTTLLEKKYLIQDPVRKTYQAGPQLVMLASSILGQSDTRTLCRPELERLSAVVKETINLTALNGFNVFYLDKVETYRSIVCQTKLGTRAYAHATCGGKILLAHQTPEYQRQYFELLPTLKPYTENTIMDPEMLRRELDEIVRNGYAVDHGEIEADLICVGAPVYDMNGKVVVTVSAAGPHYRMEESMDFMRENVMETASRLSAIFGYHALR